MKNFKHHFCKQYKNEFFIICITINIEFLFQIFQKNSKIYHSIITIYIIIMYFYIFFI